MHMLVISIVSKASARLLVFNDFALNYATQIVVLGGCIAVVGTLFFYDG
jgi:hypothetical protein